MPVVSIDLEVLIVPDDCLVFEGFQCGIANLGEHAVVSGVFLDKLRHLFSGWRVLDYELKDGFGKVQALDQFLAKMDTWLKLAEIEDTRTQGRAHHG